MDRKIVLKDPKQIAEAIFACAELGRPFPMIYDPAQPGLEAMIGDLARKIAALYEKCGHEAQKITFENCTVQGKAAVRATISPIGEKKGH